MTRFDPGTDYDRSAVLSKLGDVSRRGDFFMGPGVIALFARLGDGDDDPSLPTRDTLLWPREVPAEVVADRREVLLFVSSGDATVRYAATATASSWRASQRGGPPTNVRFHLTPMLSRAAWRACLGARGSAPVGPPPESAIAALTSTSTMEDRGRALEAFLEGWHGRPLRAPAHAVLPMLGPRALRETHRVVAAIPKAMVFNRLLAPEELRVEDGRILFLTENQGVCAWAIDATGEDPRVWYRENEAGAPWCEEPERLSGFLLQMFLFEAILDAPFGASHSSLDPASRRVLAARFDPLPLSRWVWLATRFYARDGALMLLYEDDGSVFLAARTPLALAWCEDLVDEGWDRVAF